MLILSQPRRLVCGVNSRIICECITPGHRERASIDYLCVVRACATIECVCVYGFGFSLRVLAPISVRFAALFPLQRYYMFALYTDTCTFLNFDWFIAASNPKPHTCCCIHIYHICVIRFPHHIQHVVTWWILISRYVCVRVCVCVYANDFRVGWS